MASQASADPEARLPKSPPSGAPDGGLRFDRSVIDCLALPACLCARTDGAAAWRVLAWNALAARLWGREPDPLTAEPYCGAHQLLGPDGTLLAPDAAPMAAALEAGMPIKGAEAIVVRPNGSRIRCTIDTVPLPDGTGAIAGALVMFQPFATRKTASAAGQNQDRQYQELLETLPTAVYTTDALGRLTFFNEAAVALAGRRPRLGIDEWCVSAKLFAADGTPMPHDQSPMAVALRENRPVRGVEAIAERPDGSRVHFVSYPTPQHDEAGELVGAVNMLIDFTERKDAERKLQSLSTALTLRVKQRTRALADTAAELRDSDRRFRLLVNGVTDYAIFMLDADGLVANWNAGAKRIKGYTEAEIVGRHFSLFYSDDDRDGGIPDRALAIAAAEGRFEAEGWRRRKDGSRFWANVVIDAIRTDDGKLIGFGKVTRDLTEKRAIEDQLRQAQKMEAIGQLTGGVAHDFNNLLAVVVGNVEALKRRFDGTLGPQDALFRRLTDGALRGADRAAGLTRQLLAFSRQQTLDPQPIEPAGLIDGAVELLRRSLGERVQVVTAVASDVWTVFADANQLESALLNLAVNARDAMADGGRLTIAADNAAMTAAAAQRYDEMQPGEYIVISVTDTGTGMSEAVLARAFEPFFTTKASGLGSGLGLSQVYGFAKQSGGHASLESTVGGGTTVRLHLPRFRGVVLPSADGEAAATAQSRPGARILLVEDDDLVRPCTTEMLHDLGYDAIAARDGPEALQLLAANPDIGLLFTDLGLPGPLTGDALARRIRESRPDMKILFTTGYVRSGKPEGGWPEGAEVIGKPFTFTDLSAAIGRVLDSNAVAPGR